MEKVKRAVVVWHRRSGKDKTAINITVSKMFERVGIYYYFMPTYSQGKKIIWDGMDRSGMPFLDHFPKPLIKSKNETELKIELKNGSLFQIIGTDKIDAIVGTNPVGCVFSEYSLQNPKAWDYIRPILAENGGWALFLYTPRGMNHGWKLLQQAKDSDNWFWEILTVDDTKAIGKEVLEQENKEMPSDLYQQEYYCKFLEGAGQAIRRIEENLWDGELEILPDKFYQLGVDLAKYQDWTVLTPIDLHTFKVGKIERFNQIDWNLQKSKIEAAARRYNNARIILDSTGVGDPIFDDLQKQGLNIEGFKFTEPSRKQLLENLILMMEQDKIKIPNDPILIDELRSLKWELSDRGKLRLQVPEGLHDDCIMSLALAVWGLSVPLPHKTVKRLSEFTDLTDEYEQYNVSRFHYK